MTDLRREKPRRATPSTSPGSSALDSGIDATLEIIRQLDRVATLDALGKQLLEVTACWGVEAIVAGLLPDGFGRHRTRPERSSRHWSDLTLREAIRCGNAQSAPLIDLKRPTTHLFRRNCATGEAALTRRGGPPASDGAACAKIESLFFPIVTTAGAQCGVAFFGAALTRDEAALESLSFIANYAFARMLKADRIRDVDPKLTPRQSEVLNWAAQGKTDWEIAAILNVSEHTVDKYMRQIKEALDAVNRTAAIVLAMRYGLIS